MQPFPHLGFPANSFYPSLHTVPRVGSISYGLCLNLDTKKGWSTDLVLFLILSQRMEFSFP